MATGLSMNGKKKLETIQKEFSAKFPYLTLVFLDAKKENIDGSKTLSEVRKSKGEDVSIIASQKVNSLEKNFLKNYGLIVEVAFQKDGELVITQPEETRTLNELNKWCELNGCSKVNNKVKFMTLGTNQPDLSIEDGLNSLGFSVRGLAIPDQPNESKQLSESEKSSNEISEMKLFFNLKVSKIADEFLFLDHIDQGEFEGCVRVYSFFDVLRTHYSSDIARVIEFIKLKNWEANFNYDESNIVSFSDLGDDELTKEICLNEDWDDYEGSEFEIQILHEGIMYATSEFSDDFSTNDLELIYDECKISSVEATLYKVEMDDEVYYSEDFDNLIKALSTK